MRFSSIISVILVVFLFVSCGSAKNSLNDDESVVTCGNDVVDEGETCDGEEKDCSEIDAKFISGKATCNTTCDGWDLSNCEEEEISADPECGNDAVEEGEICDGGTKPCTEIDADKYSTGTANCKDDCSGFDEEVCVAKAVCGNSVEEEGEGCDGGSVECSTLGFLTGFAACKEDCSGYETSTCLPQCGNEIIEEGEDCETGDTMNCIDLDWKVYKGGEVTCSAECGWDDTACELTTVVTPYGFIDRILVDTSVNGVTDSQKLCVPQEGEEKCEFAATYALGQLEKTPLDIQGGYANNSMIILTEPSGFRGKKKTCLAVNKGFDPLPENFFTLFASIAYDLITFDNIEMFGPQVVLMFKGDEIVPGYLNVSPLGDNDVIIAVGEQMGDGGNIDVDSLCISAIGFGQTLEVITAINPMQDGGGGIIKYQGFDIPLYHPTETPIGDVSDLIAEYGLDNICAKK